MGASKYTEEPKSELETILELASNFQKTDVGYGRDEFGRLKHWSQYAGSHPQREDKTVSVCNGRKEWEAANAGKEGKFLSVVSWNMLSDTWYERDFAKEYGHTPREYGVWEGRFPIFLRWVSSLKPDILALQEVDYKRYESDLIPELQKMGYDGSIQKGKKQNKNQPCGVATFWIREKLELLDQQPFSRSMAAHLRFKQDKKKHACIVNVHLEASQTKEGAEKRARQLNSPLEWAARVAPTSAVVACGDCNTGADASLFGALRSHKWHGHDFASVYEHPATSDTLAVNRATFAVPGHHYLIDHMLYSHDSANLRFALNAFTESEIGQHLGQGFDKGFPNEFCPSDHIPIGAIFEVFDAKEENESEESQQQPTVPQERREEIERQWAAIEAEKPLHRKGKPTAEEIAARQEYAIKVKEWKKTFELCPAEAGLAETFSKRNKK